MIIIRTPVKPPANSKIIIARGGYQVIVDAELYDTLNQFKWFLKKSSHRFYVCRRKIIRGKTFTIRMHRQITKCPSWMIVHHINQDTLDNRRANLKVISQREHRHFDGWHIFFHENK